MKMPGADDAEVPRLLFVDDEENILRALCRLLEDEEYEIATAGSGAAGLEALVGHPDTAVIVSDQRMPGMTGVEFLERSKEVAPGAVRILLTGYADINASIDAINRGGAFRYLTKPLKEGELVQTIRDAVERHGLVRKNRKLTRIINRKNEELKQWNALLEKRVHAQTARIHDQNEILSGMNERLRKSFDDLIVVFSGLIELHDEGENIHSKVVADLAGRMAAAMALSPGEVKEVTVASLLHDIGKIGAPDVILSKGSPRLTPEEYALYAQHPVRGQAAIDAIEELRPAGLLIRHHHERMDGSGFPDRLRGKAIPLGARIIAVADALDRVVASNPGDDALPLGLARVRAGLGSHFDHALFPHLESAAAGVYASARVKPLAVVRDFRLKDLEPGMVLARDVRSGTGVLLLRAGNALNEAQLMGLRRYEEIDPFPGGIFILESAWGTAHK